MASRRGHGEGGVYRETRTYTTQDGPVVSTSWVATVEDERDPATGRRRQIKLRAKTKAAALAKANEHRKRLDAGIREQPRLTVEQFPTEWLIVVLPARVGPSTVNNYGAAINGHVIPGLGPLQASGSHPRARRPVLEGQGRRRAAQGLRGPHAHNPPDALISACRRQTFGDMTSAFRFTGQGSEPPVLPDTTASLNLSLYETANRRPRHPAGPGPGSRTPTGGPGKVARQLVSGHGPH